MADQTPASDVVRVLVLCTGNSARSQIAEALLARAGGPRVVVASAGTHPAERVHPDAIAQLAEMGIDWSAARPKTIDAVIGNPWNLIITVCDNAQESCPVFPGQPTALHWGMPDPTAVEDPVARREAFAQVARDLDAQIAELVAEWA
ncbi:MAG: arsenate reductase ArsC [Gemmatimonadota bacterium]